MYEKPRQPAPVRLPVMAALLTTFLLPGCAAQTDYPPWWWTPEKRVTDVLEIAGVNENDIVYDLGSGDGRIVITAARDYGARGVGIEYKSSLVAESNRLAREAGVTDLVRFEQADFYEADFSEATVVTLYLFPETNEKLKPYMVEQLAPGTRIVTYKYKIPGWTPVKTGKRVYLYALPGADE